MFVWELSNSNSSLAGVSVGMNAVGGFVKEMLAKLEKEIPAWIRWAHTTSLLVQAY